MIHTPTRRGLITGLVSLVAAPALVRAASLMPVKAWRPLLMPPFLELVGVGPGGSEVVLGHAVMERTGVFTCHGVLRGGVFSGVRLRNSALPDRWAQVGLDNPAVVAGQTIHLNFTLADT